MTSPLIDRFTTNPASPFPAGTAVQVCFTNPNLAGWTISVTVSLPDGSQQNLTIALNAEGYGCTTWTAPAVDSAFFEHPTSLDHGVVIT